VLVVDDEPDFAALLQSILVGAGYTVATAHTCEDALVEARGHRPDLITLDVHMPRKSGVFFYRKLKEDPAFRDVPVVVVTGLTRDEEMESIIHSLLEPKELPPPAAYMEKPIDRPRFLRTVGRVLSSGTSGDR
jgi:CheY-like chemotaxis protein